jgi:hypothetical protein
MTALFFSHYEEMTGFHVLLSVQVQFFGSLLPVGPGIFGSGIIVPDPEPNHLDIKMVKTCKIFVNLNYKMVQFVFDCKYMFPWKILKLFKNSCWSLLRAPKICGSGMTWKARPGSGQNHFGSTTPYITTVPATLCFHIFLSGTLVKYLRSVFTVASCKF